MKMLLAITAVLLFPFSAMAQTLLAGDGNELLRSCNEALQENAAGPSSYFLRGYCYGLVRGTMDTGLLYGTFEACETRRNKSQPCSMQNIGSRSRILWPYCPPQNPIPLQQTVRIVVKFLNEHPEKLHEKDSYLTLEAFSAAFPCK